jgi:hypothetical protein
MSKPRLLLPESTVVAGPEDVSLTGNAFAAALV